jgi:hypothetical protein
MLNISALDHNNQLTQRQKDRLERNADRFTSYFRFTAGLSRSCPNPGGGFLYPRDSLLADLSFLWTCFSELYENFKKNDISVLVNAVVADNYCCFQLKRIVEGDPQQKGYFWTAANGNGTTARSLPFSSFAQVDYRGLLDLLRNGYSHFQWQFADLEASAYFQRMGWVGGQAPSDFPQEKAYNHTLYIADALPDQWKALKSNNQAFWSMKNLRVLATPAHLLRYHLHTLLNYLLVSQKVDVFGIHIGEI